jgi:hypothetical protein
MQQPEYRNRTAEALTAYREGIISHCDFAKVTPSNKVMSPFVRIPWTKCRTNIKLETFYCVFPVIG